MLPDGEKEASKMCVVLIGRQQEGPRRRNTCAVCHSCRGCGDSENPDISDVGVRKVHDRIHSGVVFRRDHDFRNICADRRSSSNMCGIRDI